MIIASLLIISWVLLIAQSHEASGHTAHFREGGEEVAIGEAKALCVCLPASGVGTEGIAGGAAAEDFLLLPEKN